MRTGRDLCFLGSTNPRLLFIRNFREDTSVRIDHVEQPAADFDGNDYRGSCWQMIRYDRTLIFRKRETTVAECWTQAKRQLSKS
jgi:hypothetical protein